MDSVGQVGFRHPSWALMQSVTVASDVTNPLLGPDGATRVYGPQKGCGRRILPRPYVFQSSGDDHGGNDRDDFAITPGAGAAGGLGFGLMAFAGQLFAQDLRCFQILRVWNALQRQN